MARNARRSAGVRGFMARSVRDEGVAARRRRKPRRTRLSGSISIAPSRYRPNAVRPMTSPLNPAKKKHRFGKAWMHEHVNDPYVQEAQRRGYRSRAAFKLLELDDRDKLLRPGHDGRGPGRGARELVAGAARAAGPRPAGSSQSTCCRWTRSPGVDLRAGRLSRGRGARGGGTALVGAPVDLVVSDMAPNLSGIDPVDQARSVHLGELALEFASATCEPGGDLVVKVFQGSGLAGAAAGDRRAVRQGLCPQAEVVAGPQPRDVPGRRRGFGG